MPNTLVDRWKNRRRMAWLAVLTGLSYPLLVLFTESDQLSQLAVPFYSFVTMLVLAYFGMATWDDKNNAGLTDWPPEPELKALSDKLSKN